MRGLDHEGLDVYRIARELSREINRVMRKARHKRERRDLVNQVLRATASVPLNICEGSGERAPGRRAYFFRVARGSATELAGALDHMVDMEMLAEDDTVSAKSLISRIVAMLVRLTDTVTTPASYPPLKKRSVPPRPGNNGRKRAD
jgi:four helix bundle protein